MKPVSAKQYFIALALIGLLVFTAITANLLWRVDEVQQAIAEESQAAAREEVRRAVNTVVNEVNRVAHELSQWDEVHQQLSDSTYYVYWRETRQKRKEYLPDYITALELYGRDKRSLITLQNQPLPPFIPDTSMYLAEDGQSLFAFSPILDRDQSGSIAGYLGLKINFLAALNALNRFTAIRADTLRAEPGHSGPTLPEAIFSRIVYDATEESSSSRLGDILIRSQRDYFIVFSALILTFYLMVTMLLIRPLRRLNQHIHDLRKGKRHSNTKHNAILPPISELVTARQSLDTYQSELDTIQSELDRKNVELWELAHIDALTGANNRLAFDRDWLDVLQLAKNKRIDVSLVLFDCDFFKAINDTYGHEVGDRVIQSIASRLQEVLREGDKLYRIGGDEFISIVVNCDDESAHKIAERCVYAVQSQTFDQLGIKETLKLSVGLAHASGVDTANLSELPRQADIAMYHAKGSTRDKIVHYGPELENDAYALVSNRIVSAVLSAIEHGENIEMHYQPLVAADSQQISHYESLVRINDPDGLITPADIFPVVARRRLDIELDKAVIRCIEKDLASNCFPPGVGISVNVSAAMLALSDFCEHISVFAPYLERNKIIIEVTETNFISHLQHASDCLQKLRQIGFTVALDDFGSGYSSIRYLANMPVDIVKFDISMVNALRKDARTRTMITDTAQLIHHAGYVLVAEGIEDEETLQLVKPLNPQYLQGFLFGRPQPLSSICPQDS